jgi:hypothetical protein
LGELISQQVADMERIHTALDQLNGSVDLRQRLEAGITSTLMAAAGGGIPVPGRRTAGNHESAPAEGAPMYRGGSGLEARLRTDVRQGPDGLIHPYRAGPQGQPIAQGLSVNIDPKDKFVQQHGGAFPVNSIPEGLQLLPSGRPGHYVIAPATPMTLERYQQLLNQVQLGNFNVLL